MSQRGFFLAGMEIQPSFPQWQDVVVPCEGEKPGLTTRKKQKHFLYDQNVLSALHELFSLNSHDIYN